MDDIRFVHLSDIHLTPARNKNIYGMTIDRTKKFHKIFEDILRRQIKPHFFVISGDLIHEGTADDYRELKKLIEEKEDLLGVPGFVCLGNHDDRPAFWQGYKNQTEDPRREYYYSVMLGDLRLIVLDSKSEGREEGELSDQQLNWLGEQLNHPAPMGTIIVLHHPLQSAPLHFMRYSILQNTAQLIPLLENKGVLAVLSGHIHFYASYPVAGILNSVVSAVSYGIDCTDKRVHKFMDDSGYQIVSIKDGQVMTQQWPLAASKAISYQLALTEEWTGK
ncbi:MAG: metallophosphoesterase [Sporolactobacillus sp.]